MNFYIIPSPIGNLDDITIRAINVIKEVDFLVVENKLTTKKLLKNLKLETKSGQSFRRQHQIGLNVPLFLICGRQHHKKGLNLIPSILQPLAHMEWHLLIVGNDDDGSGQELTLELKKLGLRERVTQLKSQPATELGPIYNAADLLLLPSRHENFGNVVVEAMACGCAVLISDQTGVGGDLQHGAPSGFGGVLPREQKLWTEWLRSWLKDHQLRKA